MASVTLTVTKVLKQGGKVYVRWSDGIEQEFASLADAQAVRNDLAAQASSLARRFAVARYLQLDPTGTNPALIEGHSVTVTDDSNSMVQVT
jgi:hypothetical protein